MQGRIGHQQDLLITALAADGAYVSASTQTFRYLGLRQWDCMYHFARQTANLLSQTIGIHDSLFRIKAHNSAAKVRLNFDICKFYCTFAADLVLKGHAKKN
jgi:hypothetical protein